MDTSDADAEYAARLQLEEEFEVATARVIAERDEKLARKAQRRLEAEVRREAAGSKQVAADAELARQLQRREIEASRSQAKAAKKKKGGEKGGEDGAPPPPPDAPVVVAAAAPPS